MEFQADAVGEGVALGLLHLHQNVFLRVGALGILHGSVDLAEDAEVIELALRIEEILLAERLAGSYLNLALHDVVASMVEPGDQYLVDEELIAFLDGVGNVFAPGCGRGRFRGDVECGVGKAVVEVVAEDGFAVTGEILLRVGLAFDSLKFRESLRVKLLVAEYEYRAVKSLRAFLYLRYELPDGSRRRDSCRRP